MCDSYTQYIRLCNTLQYRLYSISVYIDYESYYDTIIEREYRLLAIQIVQQTMDSIRMKFMLFSFFLNQIHIRTMILTLFLISFYSFIINKRKFFFCSFTVLISFCSYNLLSSFFRLDVCQKLILRILLIYCFVIIH